MLAVRFFDLYVVRLDRALTYPDPPAVDEFYRVAL